MGNTYKVYCEDHPDVTIYHGTDESTQDYYLRDSTPTTCWKCIREKNERNKIEAEQRLIEKRRKEAERLQKIQEERIAREQRAREEERERQETIKQEAEEERQKRIKQEIERIKQDLKMQKEEFDRKEAEKKKENEKKRKQQKQQEKKKEKKRFVKIVKDIAERVTVCSAYGQAVIDKVGDIENDLKQALKAEYDNTVKPEIERYKKYGNEMRDMNKVFINEFTIVLKSDFKERTKAIDDTFADKKEEDKQSKIDFDAILNSGLSQAEAMNKFAKMFEDKKKNKNKFNKEVDDKLNSLIKAINNMDAKLFQMEQYYDAVIEDHNKFIDFCNSEGAKYNNQMKEVVKYIQAVGSKIKDKKRDLYDGQEADVERKTWTEEYDKYTVHHEQKADINTDDVGIGAVAGTVFGTGLGFASAGPIGISAGPIGIIPGAIFGAILGACVGCKISCEITTSITKSKKTVTVKSKDYYDGNTQYEALQKIIDALQNPIKKYVDELKKSATNAERQQFESQQFLNTINGLKVKIREFKDKAKDIKKTLKECDANEKLQKNIKSECDELYAQVKAATNILQQDSNKKQEWNDR